MVRSSHKRQGVCDHTVPSQTTPVHIAVWPINAQLDQVQAAILQVKIPSLDKWNANRQSALGW